MVRNFKLVYDLERRGLVLRGVWVVVSWLVVGWSFLVRGSVWSWDGEFKGIITVLGTDHDNLLNLHSQLPGPERKETSQLHRRRSRKEKYKPKTN